MASKRVSKQKRADLWYEQNKDNDINWKSKFFRDLFRSTTYWKRFVNSVKSKRCEFCSCNSSRINIHHIYPDAYDKLQRRFFACLCYRCHTLIHQLSRRKDWSLIPEYFHRFLERKGLPEDL